MSTKNRIHKSNGIKKINSSNKSINISYYRNAINKCVKKASRILNSRVK